MAVHTFPLMANLEEVDLACGYVAKLSLAFWLLFVSVTMFSLKTDSYHSLDDTDRTAAGFAAPFRRKF